MIDYFIGLIEQKYPETKTQIKKPKDTCCNTIDFETFHFDSIKKAYSKEHNIKNGNLMQSADFLFEHSKILYLVDMKSYRNYCKSHKPPDCNLFLANCISELRSKTNESIMLLQAITTCLDSEQRLLNVFVDAGIFPINAGLLIDLNAEEYSKYVIANWHNLNISINRKIPSIGIYNCNLFREKFQN